MQPTPHCDVEQPRGYSPAPLPPDERERQLELDRLGIIDTPGEERFDRIVKLASKLFDTPIAYVSLLDGDRQWFKSRLGMPQEQTSRQSSFCGHTILQEGPLVVSDARRDMRFAGNPLVISPPFVRFYAGQPIRGPRGFKVGTLCVLDTKARTCSVEEIAILKDLGALVEHELAMRDTLAWQREAVRAREELEARERDLRLQIGQLQAEKGRLDDLFRNVLPDGMVGELISTGTVAPVFHPEVAVLFADFSGFTAHSSNLSAAEVVNALHDCFCHFDWVAAKHGVEKLKTIGDGYLAVAGMPEAKPDDALRMLRAAFEIRDYIAGRRAEAAAEGKSFWDVRIGLHLGPLVAGVVGVRKISYDVWGDTVNTASRIESAGKPGRINASRTFYERVAEHVEAENRGALECKGKGEVEMFFINVLHASEAPAPEPALPPAKRPHDPYGHEKTSF